MFICPLFTKTFRAQFVAFAACMIALIGSNTAFGKDIVLLVQNQNPEEDYQPTDEKEREIANELFQKFFTKTRFEFRIIPMSSLSDLPTTIGSAVTPQDQLRGVIFEGHGSYMSYRLSRDGHYPAQFVASYLVRALRRVNHSADLFVYFYTCHGAAEVRGVTNFQRSFFDYVWKERNELYPPLRNLEVVAHPNGAHSNTLIPMNFFERILLANSEVGSRVEFLISNLSSNSKLRIALKLSPMLLGGLIALASIPRGAFDDIVGQSIFWGSLASGSIMSSYLLLLKKPLQKLVHSMKNSNEYPVNSPQIRALPLLSVFKEKFCEKLLRNSR